MSYSVFKFAERNRPRYASQKKKFIDRLEKFVLLPRKIFWRRIRRVIPAIRTFGRKLTCKRSRVSCKNQIRFVGSLACLCSESFCGRDGNFAEVCMNLLYVAACVCVCVCVCVLHRVRVTQTYCLLVLQLLSCEISGQFCLI